MKYKLLTSTQMLLSCNQTLSTNKKAWLLAPWTT